MYYVIMCLITLQNNTFVKKIVPFVLNESINDTQQ